MNLGGQTPFRIAPAAALALLLAGTASAQQPVYTGWNQTPTPVPVTVPQQLPASIDAKPLPRTVPTTPTVPSQNIQRTQLAQAPLGYVPQSTPNQSLSLDPPGFDRVHVIKSEADMFQTWKQIAKDTTGERLVFPEPPILTREPFLGRSWPQTACLTEPHYVEYGRLMFEEVNAERYGWDLGMFGVVVSSAYFAKDFALLPYHRFTDPCRWLDSGAGLCLPGDPVPYRLYPEGLSLTGAVAEVAAVSAILAIFP